MAAAAAAAMGKKMIEIGMRHETRMIGFLPIVELLPSGTAIVDCARFAEVHDNNFFWKVRDEVPSQSQSISVFKIAMDFADGWWIADCALVIDDG